MAALKRPVVEVDNLSSRGRTGVMLCEEQGFLKVAVLSLQLPWRKVDVRHYHWSFSPPPPQITV